MAGKKNKQDASEQKEQKAIEKRKTPLLAKTVRNFTIGDLEAALLKEFPAEDAESWDHTGLLVGERGLMANRIAVALDPTVSAVEAASMANADVLITHHPAFIDAPTSFAPERSVALSPGAGVWSAIKNQVALMDFHTALDVSSKAQRVLPAMLKLEYKGKVVMPIATSRRKGYGQFCKVPSDGASPITLARLAARCTSVFGRMPRVWGDMDRVMKTAVTATGSAGNIGHACLQQGADCLICGEVKYHDALELSGAGLCVIELGHDTSELPLVALLAETLASIGFSKDCITIIDQSNNWQYPETVRL